ncbi:hypothetical protein DY000_02027215 [Brassica cretica]|uniref:DUF4283 domain-containing protein n=1 Tax=Brassica cretica TaxID=69181 RepID=A0ABQ7EG32_BRACR|nr:hypothetical protein DY000_02027215 [Brassica cretica]
MAAEKFGPHLKTILKGKHIDAIYKLWRVDYVVEIELPESGETPENVRSGYCGAYVSHFQDGGLSFPLPRFLLEEEGLEFGLRELKQLFAIKRNSGFPGTMILAPRGGCGIIEGIPNRDDRWRENFFRFQDKFGVGRRLRFREDSSGMVRRHRILFIEPFGSAPMSPELRGLMETLRRGSTRWLSFTPERIRAAYAFPPGVNRATHVALVAHVRPKRGRGTKRKKDEEVLLDRPDESSEAGSSERTRTVHRGRVLRLRSQAQSPCLPARPVGMAIKDLDRGPGPEREREKAIRRYVAPVMVVSGSMMLPVSQAPSICTGGSSSCHHKKYENSLSTEEEDLVPAMGSS